MRASWFCCFCLLIGHSIIWGEDGRVASKITTVPINEFGVTLLHLRPGFITSVRLPEEINSVALGDPSSFRAEASQGEPQLVWLKPLTLQPAESNALITTRSGHEISLHLVSSGNGASDSGVDFILEYRRPQSLMISTSETPELAVPATWPISGANLASPSALENRPDFVARALGKQKAVSSPAWEGKKDLLAAVGESVAHNHRTVVGFSVLNRKSRLIELLPPQIELTGRSGRRNEGRQIKAEPIAILEYRMTTRRLSPGERADGIVVFERPAFKQSNERLELQLAEAEQVDRPILLSIPFTTINKEGQQ